MKQTMLQRRTLFVAAVLSMLVHLLVACASNPVPTGSDYIAKGNIQSAQMQASDWDDVNELERTWHNAKIIVPVPGNRISSLVKEIEHSKIADRYPMVLYMEGCNGYWSSTPGRLNFFADNGYAVVAPNSFARHKAPTSCDPARSVGGLYRPTLIMRQQELKYALSQIKKLPWVDQNNIFVYGFSEGANTVATVSGIDVNARIIEGWGCHAGWEEYRGLNAAPEESVLSLVGDRDPWFRQPYLQGHCGEFMKNKHSQSVVFGKKHAHLRNRHALIEMREVQDIVNTFMQANRR